MAVNLSALAGAGQQFFDDSGNPLTGGKLYSYAAGTTTPLACYTSASGSTPHANPIVLDAAGRVPQGEVWLTAGENYKFALQTSVGTQIAIWDNITGINGTGITSSASSVSLTGFKSQQGFVSDLASSSGADWIGFTPTGSSSVARATQDKLRDFVSVNDFGADPTGVNDSTAAIQAAIDSFSSGQGTVYFPKGTYLVTSTVTINKDRVNLIGAGQWVTQIKFQPVADDICFFFGKGGEGTVDAGIIVQCSLRGMSFNSTNTTYRKTALELKDVSFFICEEISVGSTTQWIGNGSIGVRTRGREGLSFRNMSVQTNRPFVFALNTSFPSICLDQANFHNITTVCRGHFETVPIYSETNFFFDPGVNFSNVSFTGYQSWNRGKNGLYYDNSTLAASGSSYALNIQNVRWEGTFGNDDTGYAFYFNHGAVSTTGNILIQNVYVGEIGNGYYFRRCRDITLIECSWIRASGEALNIDNSIGSEFLQVINCFWQTSATASINSAFAAVNAIKSDNTAAVYKSAIYTAAQGLDRRDMIAGVPVNQGRIDIAATDPTVVTLPLDATATVIGTLADSRGKFALIGFNVIAKTTTLIYDDGTWSVTQGTAAKLNVYWDAVSSTWKLENKTGISRAMYFQAIGSNQ